MKLTIERGALLKSLAHVQRVVERRNTIPILSNVLLEAGDGTLGLTATDMDLTIVESIAAIVAEPGATTAPAHTLYDIVRKLPEGAQIQLEGGSDSGQIVLRAGRSRFSLQTLPKDDFPDFAGVFPANNDKVMKVDRRSFAEAVDRVSTISSEKSRAVKLSLRTKALTLSATSAENGSASEELEVDYAGNAMEIGFNARYLLDIAQQIQGEGAQFTLADSASPTVVKDVADGSALY